jgi:hypothetical protein
MELPHQQLNQWKEGLQREILELEQKIGPLMEKLADRREQLGAVEKLLGPNSNGSRSSVLHRGEVSNSRLERAAISIADASFAPTRAYWLPILQSLVELGGRSDADSVLNLVQKKMKLVLTPADYEVLPSGISVRWKNRAQWQRKNMVDQGLLRGDSPRGVWEITEDGRKWIEKN